MNNIKILVLLNVLLYLYSYTNTNHFTYPFTKINEFKSYVHLMQDAKGNKFILKKHNNEDRVIREKMGYEIGKNIVNIPYTEILSKNLLSYLFDDDIFFNISQNENTLITMHQFVEGKHDEKCLILKAVTNKKHLQNIAYNDKSLAKIAAFNMYINNHDCHEENLLKNKNGVFIVIDMDYAFYPYRLTDNCLAFNTYNYLKTLDTYELSGDEIDALKTFKDTLTQLMEKYPPEVCSTMWSDIAHNNHYYYDKEKIYHFFHDNYKEVLKTHSVLTNLINNKNDTILYSIINPSKEAQTHFWQTNYS